MDIIEFLKVVLFGIVEGYTEWLPISSTGHLILVENLVHLNQTEAFWNVFKVVIQLGAILAVVVLYWTKLWPFSRRKSPEQRRNTWILWFKIIAACVPAAVVGIPLDDILDTYLSTPTVIGLMLVVYGVAFLFLERQNRSRSFRIRTTAEMSFQTAVMIGVFQCLALIPGTSRSGATILGAMLIGCSRTAAAEFSFFLGIPVMFGASLVKILKYGFETLDTHNPFIVVLKGFGFTGTQWFILLFGMLVAFLVAVYTIKYLMNYIRRHDFTIFGYYRIVLGVIVLVYFGLFAA